MCVMFLSNHFKHIYDTSRYINSVHFSTVTWNYNCSAGFKLILDVLQMCSGSVGEPAVSTLWFSTQTAGSRPSASYNSWSCPPRGMMTWQHCWDSCTPPPSGPYNSKLTYSRSGSLSNSWQDSHIHGQAWYITLKNLEYPWSGLTSTLK